MRKHLSLLLTLLAAELILWGVGVWRNYPRAVRLTKPAARRIVKGMTLPEVVEAVGRPPGNHATMPTASVCVQELWSIRGRVDVWRDDAGELYVGIDPAGAVWLVKFYDSGRSCWTKPNACGSDGHTAGIDTLTTPPPRNGASGRGRGGGVSSAALFHALSAYVEIVIRPTHRARLPAQAEVAAEHVGAPPGISEPGRPPASRLVVEGLEPEHAPSVHQPELPHPGPVIQVGEDLQVA